MNFNPTDFNNGIRLGTDRARSKFNNPSLSISYDSRLRMNNVLTIWPRDLSGRFVELFIEMGTLANLAREENSEAQLTEDELLSFLATSSFFFNSFKHR